MSDTISRQAAIDALEKSKKTYFDRTVIIGKMQDIVNNLPSAEPERKKGKWIRITQGAMPEQYICPFCHRTVEVYDVEKLLSIRYPYCHCGADMRGEQNEID